MFCKNCGNQIDDNAVVCPHCGCATDNFNQNHRPNTPAPREDDAPNAGFAVLSFFVPIVGLILYLVWNDTMPISAPENGHYEFTAAEEGVPPSRSLPSATARLLSSSSRLPTMFLMRSAVSAPILRRKFSAM